MEGSTVTTSLAQQLKTVPVFADISEEDLAWLAARMKLGHYSPGEIIAEEGSPADRMWIILEGETRGQRENAIGDGRRTLPVHRTSRVCCPIRD